MPFHEYSELLEAFIDPELACAEGTAPQPCPLNCVVQHADLSTALATAISALARVANTQLDEVAGTLVNIFAINSRVGQFVRTLTTLEIRQTSAWSRRDRDGGWGGPAHNPAQGPEPV